MKEHSTETDTDKARFSKELREATSKVHTAAERTVFIRGFLRGTADLKSYTRLLAALHPVYRAMEEEAERLALENQTLARFHFPCLWRTEALERDLTVLAGPQWSLKVARLESSFHYESRIREVSRTEPVRLIGHLYTRYLGDLSGGQILARIAERSLGLSKGNGLDMYDFNQIDNATAMKALFRERLDELEHLPETARLSVIDEAIQAFHANIAIFEELGGSAWKSFLRNLPLPFFKAAPLPSRAHLSQPSLS